MNRKLIKDLMDAIKASDRKKTSGYDTSAVVRRIEDGTAWVHIPGGVDETPVKLTINASVGDTVQVRVSGGRAFLVGNRTAPPTDDTTAIKATYVAKNAQETAVEAKSEASEAWHYAGTAKEAAESAQDSADSAAEAAIEAWDHADDAHQAAISANNSANNALVQLSVVEDVAGTLRWISEHGSYVPTTDTTVIEGSVYFIYENGDYIPIANPDPSANPSQEGWYVLDVTESQAKYIMAHLAVTSAGLWVLPVNQLAEHPLVDSDGDQIIDSDNNPIVDFSEDPQHASGYKVLLSGTGMTVYNDEGASVAFYGETTRIGKEYDYNVHITSNEVQIRNGTTVLAKYGATTKFYEPDGVTEAAEIGANGMHVKSGLIGGWQIGANSLTRTDNPSDYTSNSIALYNKGMDLEATYSSTDYTAEYNVQYASFVEGNRNYVASYSAEGMTAFTTNDWTTVEAGKIEVEAANTAYVQVESTNAGKISSLRITNVGDRGLFDDSASSWMFWKSASNNVYVKGDSLRFVLSDYSDLSNDPQVLFYENPDTGSLVFRPTKDNVIFLGTSSNRWDTVYAANGVKTNSDLKKKDVIEEHDWKIDEFINGLKPIAYKYKDGDSGRIHMGFGAQDVAQLSKDLKIGDLSVYSADIINPKGDENLPYHGERIDDEKLTWSLQYNELIAPMILEIQKLMKRVDELETKIKEMGE